MSIGKISGIGKPTNLFDSKITARLEIHENLLEMAARDRSTLHLYLELKSQNFSGKLDFVDCLFLGQLRKIERLVDCIPEGERIRNLIQNMKPSIDEIILARDLKPKTWRESSPNQKPESDPKTDPEPDRTNEAKL